MLNGSGLYYMELRVRLAGAPSVAHIAVVRSVDFSDRFLLNRNALHCFDGNYCGHTDASAGGARQVPVKGDLR